MVTQDETQVKPQRQFCNTCSYSFRPSAPPPDGLKGWQIHNCSPCPHCGAPRQMGKNEYCSCPEGQTEKANNRVADKIAEDARAKAAKIAGEKHVRAKARYEEELAESKRPKLSPQKKTAQRDELDAELRDREQALKGRELSRSERRLDNYDAAAAEGKQVVGGRALGGV